MSHIRLGTDTRTGNPVLLHQNARFEHMLIQGASGQGKSSLQLSMILQDIKQQKGVGVIDPHGTLISDVILHMDKRRIDDVILIDLREREYRFGFNICAIKGERDVLDIQKACDQAMALCEVPFNLGKETEDVRNVFRLLLYFLLYNPGYTIADAELLFSQIHAHEYLLAAVPLSIRHLWQATLSHPRTYQRVLQHISAHLGPLTQTILGQVHSTIQIEDIMAKRKILLVRLDPTMQETTRMLGTLLIAAITTAAFARFEQKKALFALYIDEFVHLATDDITTLIDQAGRKGGVALTIAHQHQTQLHDFPHIAASLERCGNHILFQANESRDGGYRRRRAWRCLSHSERGFVHQHYTLEKCAYARLANGKHYVITLDPPPAINISAVSETNTKKHQDLYEQRVRHIQHNNSRDGYIRRREAVEAELIGRHKGLTGRASSAS